VADRVDTMTAEEFGLEVRRLRDRLRAIEVEMEAGRQAAIAADEHLVEVLSEREGIRVMLAELIGMAIR